jgi:hypothetical protein
VDCGSALSDEQAPRAQTLSAHRKVVERSRMTLVPLYHGCAARRGACLPTTGGRCAQR